MKVNKKNIFDFLFLDTDKDINYKSYNESIIYGLLRQPTENEFLKVFKNDYILAKLNKEYKLRLYLARYTINEIKRELKKLNTKLKKKDPTFKDISMFELLQSLHTSDYATIARYGDTFTRILKDLLFIASLSFNKSSIDMKLSFNLAYIKNKDIEPLLSILDNKKCLIAKSFIDEYSEITYIKDMFNFNNLPSFFDTDNQTENQKSNIIKYCLNHLHIIKNAINEAEAEAEAETETGANENEYYLKLEQKLLNEIDPLNDLKNSINAIMYDYLNLLSDDKKLYKNKDLLDLLDLGKDTDYTIIRTEAEKKLNSYCYQILNSFLSGGLNSWYSNTTYKTQLNHFISEALIKLFCFYSDTSYYIKDTQNLITFDFVKNYFVINSWNNVANNTIINFLYNANVLTVFHKNDQITILEQIKHKLNKLNIKNTLAHEKDFYTNAIQCTNDAFFTLNHDKDNLFLYNENLKMNCKRDTSHFLYFSEKVKPLYYALEFARNNIFCTYYYNCELKNCDLSVLSVSSLNDLKKYQNQKDNDGKYKNVSYFYVLASYLLAFCNNDFIADTETEAKSQDKELRFKKLLQLLYYCAEPIERAKSKFFVWLYGISGGGKSTFCEFLKTMFNENDVITLNLSRIIKDPLKNFITVQNKKLVISDEEQTQFLRNNDYAMFYKTITGHTNQEAEQYFTSDKVSFFISSCFLLCSNCFNFADIDKDGVRERTESFSFNHKTKNDPTIWSRNILYVIAQKEAKAYFLLLCILGGKLFADNNKQFIKIPSDQIKEKYDRLDADSVSLFFHDYLQSINRLLTLDRASLWREYDCNFLFSGKKLSKYKFFEAVTQKTKGVFKKGDEKFYLKFMSDEDYKVCNDTYFS